jgi:hypothetical protein
VSECHWFPLGSAQRLYGPGDYGSDFVSLCGTAAERPFLMLLFGLHLEVRWSFLLLRADVINRSLNKTKYDKDDVLWEEFEHIAFRIGTAQFELSASRSWQTKVRKCLLSAGAQSFVCQFAIQKCKDQYIQNYNFVRCFVWA